MDVAANGRGIMTSGSGALCEVDFAVAFPSANRLSLGVASQPTLPAAVLAQSQPSQGEPSDPFRPGLHRTSKARYMRSAPPVICSAYCIQ